MPVAALPGNRLLRVGRLQSPRQSLLPLLGEGDAFGRLVPAPGHGLADGFLAHGSGEIGKARVATYWREPIDDPDHDEGADKKRHEAEYSDPCARWLIHAAGFRPVG